MAGAMEIVRSPYFGQTGVPHSVPSSVREVQQERRRHRISLKNDGSAHTADSRDLARVEKLTEDGTHATGIVSNFDLKSL